MADTQHIKVLIVDDEPAAHTRLEDLLHPEPDIEIVGQVRTGRAALRAIENLEPDLVFLDVQMPGMTGLELVRKIGADHMPIVVFVTAYDRYALKAFDVAAIDYLLKPFDDDRFAETLARVRLAVKNREFSDLRKRLATLIQHISGPVKDSPPQTRYLERIAVDLRGQMRIVPVHTIDFITSSGNYAELHVGDEVHLINETMQSLEEHLDPNNFFRIHRSTIVQLDRIETLLVGAGADYAARLKNGHRLKISRRRWEELLQRLMIESPTK